MHTRRSGRPLHWWEKGCDELATQRCDDRHGHADVDRGCNHELPERSLRVAIAALRQDPRGRYNLQLMACAAKQRPWRCSTECSVGAGHEAVTTGKIRRQPQFRTMQHPRTFRSIGGPVIEGLSLHDNLLIEQTLGEAGSRPALVDEFQSWMSLAGCPVDLDAWRHRSAAEATPLEVMQVRVGRAWLGDPQALYVEPSAWDDSVWPFDRLEQAFRQRHPWRTLKRAGLPTEL